jgi:hypothetical protein
MRFDRAAATATLGWWVANQPGGPLTTAGPGNLRARSQGLAFQLSRLPHRKIATDLHRSTNSILLQQPPQVALATVREQHSDADVLGAANQLTWPAPPAVEVAQPPTWAQPLGRQETTVPAVLPEKVVQTQLRLMAMANNEADQLQDLLSRWSSLFDVVADCFDLAVRSYSAVIAKQENRNQALGQTAYQMVIAVFVNLVTKLGLDLVKGLLDVAEKTMGEWPGPNGMLRGHALRDSQTATSTMVFHTGHRIAPPLPTTQTLTSATDKYSNVSLKVWFAQILADFRQRYHEHLRRQRQAFTDPQVVEALLQGAASRAAMTDAQTGPELQQLVDLSCLRMEQGWQEVHRQLAPPWHRLGDYKKISEISEKTIWALHIVQAADAAPKGHSWPLGQAVRKRLVELDILPSPPPTGWLPPPALTAREKEHLLHWARRYLKWQPLMVLFGRLVRVSGPPPQLAPPAEPSS